MKRLFLFALAVALGLGVGSRAATQQMAQAAPGAAADKTGPSYDMKGQSIVDLQDMQKKFADLAQAIPADKYGWRPSPEIRTVSELFLHVAGANYGIPNMLGVPTPAGFNGKTYEKSTTDKAKVIEELNKSFVSAIAMVQNMSNSDFAKPEKKLGPDANDGDIVYLLVVHAHEQLGQAIIYARSNGVVPPWTAAAQKKNP
jgi:uncharacterized damage-inducible protein DinB